MPVMAALSAGCAMTRHRNTGLPDANQSEIIKAMQQEGAKVANANNMGGGFPDLIVGFRKCNILMEVVSANKLKNNRERGGLSEKQQDWHDDWPGRVYTVRSVEEALNVLHGEAQGVLPDRGA